MIIKTNIFWILFKIFYFWEIKEIGNYCSSSPRLSPIDIQLPFTGKDFKLGFELFNVEEIFYKSLEKNVVWVTSNKSFGNIKNNKNEIFNMKELYFKFPSDHSFVGNKFPLELQIKATGKADFDVYIILFFNLMEDETPDKISDNILTKWGLSPKMLNTVMNYSDKTFSFKEKLNMSEFLIDEFVDTWYHYEGISLNKPCNKAKYYIFNKQFEVAKSLLEEISQLSFSLYDNVKLSPGNLFKSNYSEMEKFFYNGKKFESIINVKPTHHQNNRNKDSDNINSYINKKNDIREKEKRKYEDEREKEKNEKIKNEKLNSEKSKNNNKSSYANIRNEKINHKHLIKYKLKYPNIKTPNNWFNSYFLDNFNTYERVNSCLNFYYYQNIVKKFGKLPKLKYYFYWEIKEENKPKMVIPKFKNDKKVITLFYIKTKKKCNLNKNKSNWIPIVILVSKNYKDKNPLLPITSIKAFNPNTATFKKIKLNKNTKLKILKNQPKVNPNYKKPKILTEEEKIKKEKRKKKKMNKKFKKRLKKYFKFNKKKPSIYYPQLKIRSGKIPKGCRPFWDGIDDKKELIFNIILPKINLVNFRYSVFCFIDTKWRNYQSKKILIPIFILVSNKFVFSYDKKIYSLIIPNIKKNKIKNKIISIVRSNRSIKKSLINKKIWNREIIFSDKEKHLIMPHDYINYLAINFKKNNSLWYKYYNIKYFHDKSVKINLNHIFKVWGKIFGIFINKFNIKKIIKEKKLKNQKKCVKICIDKQINLLLNNRNQNSLKQKCKKWACKDKLLSVSPESKLSRIQKLTKNLTNKYLINSNTKNCKKLSIVVNRGNKPKIENINSCKAIKPIKETNKEDNSKKKVKAIEKKDNGNNKVNINLNINK